MLTDIRSQTAEELEAQFRTWGQPAYRVAQLLKWLYVHRATNWDAMTNLPKALREELRRKNRVVRSVRLKARDGTISHWRKMNMRAGAMGREYLLCTLMNQIGRAHV